MKDKEDLPYFSRRRASSAWKPNANRYLSKDYLPFLDRGYRSRLAKRLRRWRVVRILLQYWKILLAVFLLARLEIYLHGRKLAVERPKTNLDPPFYYGCESPVRNTTERVNAAMLMLARNSDLEGAIASVRSVNEQFNQNFGYPWVFLNDQPFSDEFIEKMTEAVGENGGGASVTFDTIPADMWGYPKWIDKEKSKSDMQKLEDQGIMYSGIESYHHMCRFNSGFFYDLPALRDYKWYWRVEPDISFTCTITYDPFYEMERHNKVYGWIVALWEIETTVPTLFHAASKFKEMKKIPTSNMWKTMLDPSRAPWPFRSLLANKPGRDVNGDMWNMCHFWSNFEIADMDFYRSQQYREFFDYLDGAGGFYYERWGDAPVHSLAAAMLLRPEQLHHFSEFGYIHEPFQYCPYGPTMNAMKPFEVAPSPEGHFLRDYPDGQLGCNCKCDPDIQEIAVRCYNRIRAAAS